MHSKYNWVFVFGTFSCLFDIENQMEREQTPFLDHYRYDDSTSRDYDDSCISYLFKARLGQYIPTANDK